MKRLSIFITLLFLSMSAQNAIARQALDKIIAIINDDVITQSELNDRVADFIVQLKIDKNSKSDIEALSAQVLARMIRTRIQMQMAAQVGITIDDISLNRMIEKIAQSNSITMDELRSTLAKDGINFAHFREQTREDLIIKQLQQRTISSKINISDQEIQRFIDSKLKKSDDEKFQIQHILIATPESASSKDISKAKAKSDALYSEIKNGANFTTLAIHKSDGRNALKGGDLGWRNSNELPESFVDAVTTLATNETATPIQSASGFHILKLIDKTSKKSWVTQTQARHILISTNNEISDEDARQLLQQLKQRIEQGENFAKLAGEHSQDPGSKIKGGDLGWADPGTFVPEFEDTMNSLDKNEISKPFRSQFGWHILQVLNRREQDKTQANLEAQARSAIHKRKYDEELRLWLRRIRNEAFVEIVGNIAE